ncbi:TetR/AcrR family transcriptional regulator [Tsukamurella paurometabola]|uniref:TetR/AcrR family transcriptional regulator n=1 Tax=Tsukamurella paurometabola TaxID=2061 RepID=A0ABS5NI68_TSUPA|nr:TetR/AcrR family transcriptional regulator [Tsukamurella paurometabola]MBS4103133.1 TetR/AcrR family transcriptional regulator [Tsukamurella paurometabola]
MDSASDVPRPRGRPGGSSGADLLAIARDLFLDRGFAGTTMDAVAAGARISKQTLYRQYPSKDGLYAAVVRDWVDRGRDAMRPHLDALIATDDVGRGLRSLARTLQAGVLSAPVLRMRTLVAAEAHRFPEVADDYVRRSWDRNLALLADALAHLAARGLLRIDSPAVAAEQFTWLALAAPLNRLTLTGGRTGGTQEESDAVADAAVATFLARYAAPDSGA